MRNLITFTIVVSLILGLAVSAAVRGDKAMYVGGTVTEIPEKQKGKLNLEGQEVMVFNWKKKKVEHQWELPYTQISRMEYGQKAGRRVGVAIAVNPLFLFSKKRKHYFTFHFIDNDGAGQAAVFELSKKIYRPVWATLEAKTGLTVEDTTLEKDEKKGE